MMKTTHGKYTELVENLFEKGWFEHLKPFIDSPEFDKIIDFLKEEKRLGKTITPFDKNCFKAFKECPFDKVKVVIIGQDPYPNIINNHFEADGLAFSYTKSNADDNHVPKSLNVILREVQRDVYNNEAEYSNVFIDTNLSRWAKQGVLLLNSSLTTLVGNPNGHRDLWTLFIEYTLNQLNLYHTGVIYLLWGKDAQKNKEHIYQSTNHVLECPHPAAQFYSGGKITFSGCSHFSKTNEIIEKNNGRDFRINW